MAGKRTASRGRTSSVKDDTREDTTVRYAEGVDYPTQAEVAFHQNKQKQLGFVDDLLSMDKAGRVLPPDQKVDADPNNEAGQEEADSWKEKVINYFGIPKDWVLGAAVYPDMVIVVHEPKRDYRYPDIANRLKSTRSIKKIFYRRPTAEFESRYYKK